MLESDESYETSQEAWGFLRGRIKDCNLLQNIGFCFRLSLADICFGATIVIVVADRSSKIKSTLWEKDGSATQRALLQDETRLEGMMEDCKGEDFGIDLLRT